METKKAALNVAGVIFLVVSILHLVRFLFRTEVIIANYAVPLWSSFVAFVVAFLLSLWMFKSIR